MFYQNGVMAVGRSKFYIVELKIFNLVAPVKPINWATLFSILAKGGASPRIFSGYAVAYAIPNP